jgi:hypothetical protein
MKNIHVLPTTQKSRLATKDSNGKLEVSEKNTFFVNGWGFTPQNIYITYDEEIKEWFIVNGTNGFSLPMRYSVMFPNGHDKSRVKLLSIVLTTDQDLINDGVQPIPDEFLEWFVKNPSCERVDVDYRYDTNLQPILDSFGNKVLRIKIPTESENLSQIIIPKEEQKQHIIDIMKSDEELGLYEQTKCYCGHTITCNCGPLEEPKQWLKNPKWGVRLTKDKKLNFKVDFLKLVYPESPSFSSVNWKIFDTKELAEEWIKNPILSNEKPKQETLEQTFSLEQISKNFMGEIQNGGYFDDYIDFKLGLDTYNTESFRVHADSIKDRRYITFKTWFETIRENNYER